VFGGRDGCGGRMAAVVMTMMALITTKRIKTSTDNLSIHAGF
jgi:hypothetical protein